MMHVILKDLHFHCGHGLYKEESLTGGDFVVNVQASYQPNSLPVVSLGETVDYTRMYALVKKRMEHPTPLIETLVTELAIDILHAFPIIEMVMIQVEKLHPPIIAFQGGVAVSFELKRSDL